VIICKYEPDSKEVSLITLWELYYYENIRPY
jgi:hypothetical protein